jgi:putative flippase GtrA
MCYVIYISLLGLALLYSDSIIHQYALSVISGENQMLTVALGWEIIPALWPLFLLAMVLASAVTFLISRKIFSRHKPS